MCEHSMWTLVEFMTCCGLGVQQDTGEYTKNKERDAEERRRTVSNGKRTAHGGLQRTVLLHCFGPRRQDRNYEYN